MMIWRFPESNQFKHKYNKKIAEATKNNAGVPMTNIATNTWETLNQCLSGREVADFSMVARFAVTAHVNVIRATEHEEIARDTEMFTDKLVEIIIRVLRLIAKSRQA